MFKVLAIFDLGGKPAITGGHFVSGKEDALRALASELAEGSVTLKLSPRRGCLQEHRDGKPFFSHFVAID